MDLAQYSYSQILDLYCKISTGSSRIRITSLPNKSCAIAIVEGEYGTPQADPDKKYLPASTLSGLHMSRFKTMMASYYSIDDDVYHIDPEIAYNVLQDILHTSYNDRDIMSILRTELKQRAAQKYPAPDIYSYISSQINE